MLHLLDLALMDLYHTNLVSCSLLPARAENDIVNVLGYDVMASAMSGLMGITGTPEVIIHFSSFFMLIQTKKNDNCFDLR
jgi:hypothetical protein